MSKIETFFRLLRENPKEIGKVLSDYFAKSRLSHAMPDEMYLKMRYRIMMGKKLDLENPQTFNEKLQWLKLHDRNPAYTRMVDKQAVKQYVAELIGEEHIIPTIAVFDNVNEIDLATLPKQFVMKCTHDSGSVILCKDKDNFDLSAAKSKLGRCLRRNMYWWGREWPYKDVPRRIIAEKYMDDGSAELKDYKFMCFGGEAKCSFACTDRFSKAGLHVTFFDREWNVMPFERQYPSCKKGLPKPKNYEKMIELAETLSASIPFLRVDFYEVDGFIYFGELTFYPGNGMEEFSPEQWDYILGSWINISQVKK